MSEVTINQDHVARLPLEMLRVKEIGGWETYLAISPEASLTSPFSLLFNPQI